MRVRMVKPEFWANEQLGACDPVTALLYIGLWCAADRRGILRDRPGHIRATLFAYRNIDVEPHLAELCRLGLIKRYTMEGIRCIKIPTFGRHQHFHHREKPSSLPDIDGPEACPRDAPVKPEASPTASAYGLRNTASRDTPKASKGGKEGPMTGATPSSFGWGSETQEEANAAFKAQCAAYGIPDGLEGHETQQ